MLRNWGLGKLILKCLKDKNKRIVLGNRFSKAKILLSVCLQRIATGNLRNNNSSSKKVKNRRTMKTQKVGTRPHREQLLRPQLPLLYLGREGIPLAREV